MKYSYFIPQRFKSDRLYKNNLIANVLNQYEKSTKELTGNDVSLIRSRTLLDRCNIHGGLRLVWYECYRYDLCLYVLRYMKLHDDYDHDELPSEDFSLSIDEKAEVEFFLKDFFKKETREILPDEYRKYEGKRAFDKHKDTVIYELPLWHETTKELDDKHWHILHQTIYKGILGHDVEYKRNTYDFFHYITSPDNYYTITYRISEENDIYLLQAARGATPDFDELLSRSYDCSVCSRLMNISTKCYPDYITIDLDLWIAVEKDPEANLALSEEEVNILQNVEYPFFVSGLAGSGKSTVLYYLYANIYKYVAREHPDHKLLFLSYNETLVDKARRTVKSILNHHDSNQDFCGYFDNLENEIHFEKTFVPFRDFLKREFLKDEDLELFNEERHLTYERFRDLYKNECRIGNNRLSPSILWSVIRTFIKGRGIKFFTVEDYASDTVARDDRSVDLSVYKQAYKIWDNWYRHYAEEGKYWDDLDLVRYVLTHGDPQKVYHTYSIIFCDEAQDFTKIEIDLILRLSIYSKYKLSTNADDQKIPVAFAGDPNQTINPTGFRWAGTKAIFSEAFKDALDGYKSLNTCELCKNYRSQLGIVKLANSIQSIRYKHFEETLQDRKLQSVRDEPDGELKDTFEYVGFYSYTQYKNIIIANLKNANVITSGDGEEGDLSLFPDITNKDVKLYTAIGTKGLEYNAVMLLNFATDSAIQSFQRIISGEDFKDESERFELAHFFTKLYIAISRARQQLFIVDTDKSYEQFWKYLTEPELWECLIAQFINDEDKRRLVGRISLGDIATLPQRLSNSYDPEENGRQAFDKAKGERNVSLMQRAQGYFMEAGLTALADECDAYIFLFNNEYQKAGDKFLSLSQEDKKNLAVDAYWKGQCWDKLDDLVSQRSSTSAFDKLRRTTARYMNNVFRVSEFIQSLIDNIDDFQNATTEYIDDRLLWKNVLKKIEKDLSDIESVNITISLINNLRQLSKYVMWYDNGFAGLRAMLHFKRAEFTNSGIGYKSSTFKTLDYKEAIVLWEMSKSTNNNPLYFKAKKVTSNDISEEIHWMDRLREHMDILQRYGDVEMGQKLTDEAANIVLSIILGTKDFDRALNYPYPKDIETKWHRLYSNDKKMFLLYCLEHFSYDKYVFLEERMKNEDATIFEDHLPKAFYDKMFNIRDTDDNEQPYWTYFTCRLKDTRGNLILKKGEYRGELLDALSDIINNNTSRGINKEIASCFIEYLFDDTYNVQRTKRYSVALCRIFGSGQITKDDFRRTSAINRYFKQYADLDSYTLDKMKDNIRNFVQQYIVTSRKVTTKTADEVKTLLRAYEICAPRKENRPDFESIYKTYIDFIKNPKLIEIKDWMIQRMLFNQTLYDNLIGQSSLQNLKEGLERNNMTLQELALNFSREDAVSFIDIVVNDKGKFIGNDSGMHEKKIDIVVNNEGEYSFEKSVLTSELIYKHHIRKADFRPFGDTDKIVNCLVEWIDKAIKEIVSDQKHIKEYELKILTFTWEAFFGHYDVAERYDELINTERIARVGRLTNYFKRRALVHYAQQRERGKSKLYEKKQDEYDLYIDKDELMQSDYPKIERDMVSPMTEVTLPPKTKELTKEELIKKEAEREMARKLKNEMHLPIDAIKRVATLLSDDEIKEL